MDTSDAVEKKHVAAQESVASVSDRHDRTAEMFEHSLLFMKENMQAFMNNTTQVFEMIKAQSKAQQDQLGMCISLVCPVLTSVVFAGMCWTSTKTVCDATLESSKQNQKAAEEIKQLDLSRIGSVVTGLTDELARYRTSHETANSNIALMVTSVSDACKNISAGLDKLQESHDKVLKILNEKSIADERTTALDTKLDRLLAKFGSSTDTVFANPAYLDTAVSEESKEQAPATPVPTQHDQSKEGEDENAFAL